MLIISFKVILYSIRKSNSRPLIKIKKCLSFYLTLVINSIKVFEYMKIITF